MNTKPENHKVMIAIPIAKLKASPTNPRKRFDPQKLSELVESVRSMGGVQVPPLVRPLWCVGLTFRSDIAEALTKIDQSKWAGEYEIIAGERRFRAASMVPLESIECVVRIISDDDALELQLVENIQRVDLSFREEAESYAALLARKNEDGSDRFTLASIAERIGRSPEYVAQRVKLLGVPVEALEAADEGKISFRHLRMISQLPTRREDATRDILHPESQAEPLNFTDAQAWLRRYYMVPILKPAFALDNADLVPAELDEVGERKFGGACVDCPFNSRNIAEMANLDPTGARPLCTLPACYNRKTDAAWDEARSAALKEGKRVLSAEEAEKVFGSSGDKLPSSSPYVELSDQVPAELLRENVKRAPSWQKLMHGIPEKPVTILVPDQKSKDGLGVTEKLAKLAKPEIIVVRDASGGIHELIDRRQAEAAHGLAVKAGKSSPVLRDDVKPGSKVTSEEDERKKKNEQAKIETAIGMRAIAEFHKAFANQGMVEGFLDRLLDLAFLHAGSDGAWWVVKRLGITPPEHGLHAGKDYEKGLREAWKDVKSTNERLAYIVELLLAGAIRFRGLEHSGAVPWLELYGVKAKEIASAVKAEFSGKKSGKKKKAAGADPVAETIDAAAAVAAVETLAESAPEATEPEKPLTDVEAAAVSALEALKGDLYSGPLPCPSFPETEFTFAVKEAPTSLLWEALGDVTFYDPTRILRVKDEIKRREVTASPPEPESPPPSAGPSLEITDEQRKYEAIVKAVRAKGADGISLLDLGKELGAQMAEILKWWSQLGVKGRKALGLRKSGNYLFWEGGAK